MSHRNSAGSRSNPAPHGRLFTGPEISDFLLRACHDLRTPLRAMRAHAELLVKSGGLPVTGAEPGLAFIIEGGAKMDQLVDGLAGYSLALRIDPESFVPMPLGVLLRSVLARLEKELRDNQAEVTSGELPRVSCDADRLMQLFENLLVSALRRRGQVSPRIHITAAAHAEGWLFAFRDNGPCIEPADLERIFQTFARMHSAHGAGSGLEMATCREIVERHGGRIWAEPPDGSGGGSDGGILFTLPA